MKELRIAQGLTHADVASRLGVDTSTVRNWETGRTLPKWNVYQVKALMQMYQCSFEDLSAAVERIQAATQVHGGTQS